MRITLIRSIPLATNMTAAFLGLGIGLTLFGAIFSMLIALVMKKS